MLFIILDNIVSFRVGHTSYIQKAATCTMDEVHTSDVAQFMFSEAFNYLTHRLSWTGIKTFGAVVMRFN